MTSRKILRSIYNVLDILMLRKFVQRVILKIAIMEIEDEN